MSGKSLGTIRIWVLFSFLLPLLIGLYLVVSSRESEILINCDIQHSSCTRQLSGVSVTFNILPKPVIAMKDLTFEITIAGKTSINTPYIDLDMPGMDMGLNRIEMKAIDDIKYKGTGVIVRCPTGKTVWRAQVNIPGTGTIDYVFNVVY